MRDRQLTLAELNPDKLPTRTIDTDSHAYCDYNNRYSSTSSPNTVPPRPPIMSGPTDLIHSLFCRLQTRVTPSHISSCRHCHSDHRDTQPANLTWVLPRYPRTPQSMTCCSLTTPTYTLYIQQYGVIPLPDTL